MATPCVVQSARRIQFYGWDSPTEIWHGPDELEYDLGGARRLLKTLRRASGRSWFGAIKWPSAEGADNRFFAVIHDLGDCAVAMIYCDESKAGPAEVLAVIPAERRSRLRAEFPFEFMAFTSFLRSISEVSTEQLYEKMTAALAETSDTDSLVISITTGLWLNDLDCVLSSCAEMVAMAMLGWSGE